MGKKKIQTEKYISNRVLYDMLCASHGEIAEKLAYLLKYSIEKQNRDLLKKVKEIITEYGTERIEKKAKTESEFVMVLVFDEKSLKNDLRKMIHNLYKDFSIDENENS